MSVIWHGFRDALLMAWEVGWALVLGFTISAMVQAWAPRERVQRALGGSGPGPIVRATGLGAASSSCSYAAVAIARSLFAQGASVAATFAFELASTNLVWELGLVLWVLIGWQFTVAEYLGGLVMIALVALLARAFVSRRLEQQARARARAPAAAHHHHHHHGDGQHGLPGGLRAQLGSRAAWTQVARYFQADWLVLWKEIAVGLLLAGFVAQLGDRFFESLFLKHAAAPLPAIENVLVGPVIAVLSFVCSVGNVPLAAVLWSGGSSFAGVLAFLLADLIVLPILVIYRKYYGGAFALRIAAIMFAAMVVSGLVVSGLFSLLGAIPTGARPTRAAIFGSVGVNYKLALNVLGLLVVAALSWLAATGREPHRVPAG
ncbi:MAG: permease [Solirubrobacterales bacterium]|nr:permease [Solirubrobacterales bacterium]